MNHTKIVNLWSKNKNTYISKTNLTTYYIQMFYKFQIIQYINLIKIICVVSNIIMI